MGEIIKPIEMKYSNGEKEYLTPIEYKINSFIKELLPEGCEFKREYSITNYYKSGDFTVNSVNAAMENILNDMLFDPSIDMNTKHKLVNVMAAKAMEIVNKIYNDIACKNSEHIYTFSIDDINEIQFEDKIVDSLNRAKDEETEESIQNVYNTINRVLRDRKFDNNLLAVTYRAGGVKKQQFLQCFGVRGFAANLESRIYKKPVISNYNLGYQTTYDLAADSVSAAVAMYYSTTAIQDSETFSKQIRAVATRITTLRYEDCGSEEYVKVTIRPDGELYGEFLPSDLIDYKGKFYKLNPNDKELKVIKGNEEHLKGKSIYIRSGFNCKCENPRHVCIYCLGLNALNSNPNDILGLYILTVLADTLNQIVLSTKHHIASAVNDTIKFKDEIAYKYIRIGKDKNDSANGNELKLIKGNAIKGSDGYGNKGELIVLLKEFHGLRDIDKENINSIVASKISRISKIWIDRNEADRPPIEIEIKQGDRYAYFTNEFIKYLILKNKYRITDDGEYVRIILDEWKSTNPVFIIPEATFDYRVFGKSVRSLINNSERLVNYTKEQLFVELHELISRKININVSVLEVLIKTMMCKDPANGDYRLAKWNEPYTLVGPKKINTHSSVANALVLGEFGSYIFKYRPYIADTKMDSIYDPILMPELLDRQ